MRKRITFLLCIIATLLIFVGCDKHSVASPSPKPAEIPAPLAAQEAIGDKDSGEFFDFTVSRTITSDMVIQRNQYINIWGFSDNIGGVIYADFNGATRYAIVDSDGQWFLQFSPSAANTTAQTLKVYIKHGEAKEFNNILIGDVWFVGGQSNAQISLDSTLKNNPEFEQTISANDNIRVFTQWFWDYPGLIPEPLKDIPSSVSNEVCWKVADTAIAKSFSAVGYYFAKKVADNSDVPIGMIQVVAGGARLCDFMPPDKYIADKHLKGDSQFAPCHIYNMMMAPFKNTRIAGILFYQGEANIIDADVYAENIVDYVNMMREIYGQSMAFYNVQITSHADPQDKWIGLCNVRYAQLDVMNMIDNYYVVCAMDYGSNSLDDDWAHPRNKKHIGDRLAFIALANIYNKKEFKMADYGSPRVIDVEIKDGSAYVYFENVGDGLRTAKDDDTRISGFYINGSSAEGTIYKKNCIKLTSTKSTKILTADDFEIVYGKNTMSDQRTCNVQNSNGIGVLAFKWDETDSK